MKKVLTNGYLIDGTIKTPLANATIILDGDRIEAVGRAAEITLPPGAEVIDLAGRFILPGLIDLHCHCTYHYYFHSETARAGKSPYSNTFLALEAIQRLQEALQAGQTTLQDMGAVGNIIYDLRRAIEGGIIQGPRLRVCGQIIEPTGVHSENRISVKVTGEDTIRATIRNQIQAGADFIKLAINNTEWTQAELNAGVDEAHRRGLKAACHVVFPASTKMAIAAGVDSLEHARYFDDEDIAAMVDQNIAWVAVVSGVRDKIPIGEAYLKKPGLPPALRQEVEETLALSRKIVEVQADHFERALAAGVKIGAGTDRTGAYGKDPFADLVRELEVMHQLGQSPIQAIQSATSIAADIMGWQDRVGTIAPGLLADILVVNGNPLEDLGTLRDVALVIKEGEVVVDKTWGDTAGV